MRNENRLRFVAMRLTNFPVRSETKEKNDLVVRQNVYPPRRA